MANDNNEGAQTLMSEPLLRFVLSYELENSYFITEPLRSYLTPSRIITTLPFPMVLMMFALAGALMVLMAVAAPTVQVISYI